MLFLVLSACLVLIVNGQTSPQCPLIEGSELGSFDAPVADGLVSLTYRGGDGGGAQLPRVQIFEYNVVCLTTGTTRDTYQSVSVVVNYTCIGISCEGITLLSQFEFGCETGPQWSPSLFGSTDGIRTTPADGNLSTPLRTDCGLCASPQRFPSLMITNNENHCGGRCDSRLTFNYLITSSITIHLQQFSSVQFILNL